VEVVVVIDGDPDAAAPVEPSDDGHRRVVVLRNERSPGPSGARNTGILAASGEIVAFLDDDDRWLDGKLARQVDALEAGATVCVTGVEYRTEQRAKRYVPSLHGDPTRAIIELGAFLPLSATLARRDAVVHAGLFDEAMWVGEDTDLSLRLASTETFAVVPEPLVVMHRGHRNRLSLDYRRHERGLGLLLERHDASFARFPTGLSRRYWRLAGLALAAGERSDARRWAWRAIRRDPRRGRNWAMVVAVTAAPARLFDRLFAAYQTLGWRPLEDVPELSTSAPRR
jgi:glycosyltransferase involved in cell wall biosynthesis